MLRGGALLARWVGRGLVVGCLAGCGSSDGSSPGAGAPGTVEELAPAVFPISLTLDGDVVWFGDYSSGTISRVAKSGGSAELVASDQVGVWDLAVDATHVYFTRASNSNTEPEANSVSRVAKQGGAVEVLATQQAEARRLVVDDDNVYFSALHGDGVFKLPKTGGTPELIGPADSAHDVIIVGDEVCWSASIAEGEIGCVAKAGGSARTVVNTYDPRGLASDGKTLYYSSTSVASVALAGGAETILFDGKNAIPSVAHEGANVFWVTQGYGKSAVQTMSNTGGPATTLAIAGVPSPTTVRADASHVYWVDNTGGTDGHVRRTPR